MNNTERTCRQCGLQFFFLFFALRPPESSRLKTASSISSGKLFTDQMEPEHPLRPMVGRRLDQGVAQDNDMWKVMKGYLVAMRGSEHEAVKITLSTFLIHWRPQVDTMHQ